MSRPDLAAGKGAGNCAQAEPVSPAWMSSAPSLSGKLLVCEGQSLPASLRT